MRFCRSIFFKRPTNFWTFCQQKISEWSQWKESRHGKERYRNCQRQTLRQEYLNSSNENSNNILSYIFHKIILTKCNLLFSFHLKFNVRYLASVNFFVWARTHIQWALLNGIMVNRIIWLMVSNWPWLSKQQMSLNSILCIEHLSGYSHHWINGISCGLAQSEPIKWCLLY